MYSSVAFVHPSNLARDLPFQVDIHAVQVMRKGTWIKCAPGDARVARTFPPAAKHTSGVTLSLVCVAFHLRVALFFTRLWSPILILNAPRSLRCVIPLDCGRVKNITRLSFEDRSLFLQILNTGDI